MKKLLLLLILSFLSVQSFAAGCPDGSEPVKSISADGSYYVYSCGDPAPDQVLTSVLEKERYCGTNFATVIPEQWTCFESPLMDIEIPEDWKLINDYDKYQEIISLNAAPRLIGFANNPPKSLCMDMLHNFEKFSNNSGGRIHFAGCLYDLRARLYEGEGDRDYVREIFEHWARVGLDQPKDGGIGGKDYTYFLTLNYASGIYAQEKDNIEFSDTFKAWLTDRLLNVEFRSFRVQDAVNPFSYRCKEILYDFVHPLWMNDCGTTRFIITEAWLVGGLALGNKEIFDEGIDSLQYITSLFNDENIHPWLSRGIRAMGYYNQIPTWLSNYAVILDTVGYDFMEHEMPNGSKVHEAIKFAFDVVWADDLSMLYPIISMNLASNQDQNFAKMLLPLHKRQKYGYLPSKPQKVVRQSLRYVDEYQPELKELYGYEEVYSKNVTGTEDFCDPGTGLVVKTNCVYHDLSFYAMHHVAGFFDMHSIYKASDKVFFSEENIEARRIAEEAARKAVEEEAARTAAFEKKLAELAAQLEENLAAEAARIAAEEDAIEKEIAELEAQLAAEEEACKVSELNGEYIATWFFGNVNDNQEPDLQGSESLFLDKCVGEFESVESFQPAKELRKNLQVNYKTNGQITISGHIDLWDVGRSYHTVLKGDLSSGEISGIWEEGDLIKIEITKVNN